MNTILSASGRQAPLMPPVDDDQATAMVQPLITKRAAADLLGVSERTVDRLVVSGRLRAYRIGVVRRFKVSDLEAFIEDNEVSP